MNGIKELLTYLTNQFKFWFIIKEWENGLHLRNGRIIKELKYGIYFKIPLLDAIYAIPKRMQEVGIGQVNFTTKDKQQITASATVFLKTNYSDFDQDIFEKRILEHLKLVKGKYTLNDYEEINSITGFWKIENFNEI